MKKIFLLLVVLFVFSSCKKSESAVEEGSDMDTKVSAPSPPSPPEVDQIKFVKPVVAKSEETTAVETIEQKIIKNGNLKYETDNLDTTYAQIKAAIKKANAYVQNDNEGKEYGSLYRRITVRIPSQNFDDFIKNVSNGVSYFDEKIISSEDVTAEYIDLDARLKAKRKLENRYMELLAKATKISEMLEIEGQLSAIREEIEAKEGQLKYLQNQVSLSTVTIEFYKTIVEGSGVPISYGSKAWDAFKSGISGLSSFFLGVLEIWPFVLILGGGIYFFKKRIQHKKNN